MGGWLDRGTLGKRGGLDRGTEEGRGLWEEREVWLRLLADVQSHGRSPQSMYSSDDEETVYYELDGGAAE